MKERSKSDDLLEFTAPPHKKPKFDETKRLTVVDSSVNCEGETGVNDDSGCNGGAGVGVVSGAVERGGWGIEESDGEESESEATVYSQTTSTTIGEPYSPLLQTLKKCKRQKREHKCSRCDFKTSTFSRIRAHQQTHHNVCEECSETFSTFHQLRTHRAQKHVDEFKCSHCDYQHRKRAMVRRHFEQCHVNGVACPVVGCSVTTAFNRLRIHLKAAHPSEVFSKQRLRSLQEAKTAASPAQSDMQYTGMAKDGKPVFELNISGDEELEEVDETEETPEAATGTDAFNTQVVEKTSAFFCEECGHSFPLRSNLMRHIAAIHEKRYKNSYVKKKYVCEVEECKKVLRTPQALQDHYNTHKGIRPYGCEICGKRYADRATFAVHLKRYHLVSIKQVACIQQLSQGCGDKSLRAEKASVEEKLDQCEVSKDEEEPGTAQAEHPTLNKEGPKNMVPTL